MRRARDIKYVLSFALVITTLMLAKSGSAQQTTIDASIKPSDFITATFIDGSGELLPECRYDRAAIVDGHISVLHLRCKGADVALVPKHLISISHTSENKLRVKIYFNKAALTKFFDVPPM